MLLALAWSPLLEYTPILAGDGEREPLHAVLTSGALPSRGHHLRHRHCEIELHQLPGQIIHLTPVPGAGCRDQSSYA